MKDDAIVALVAKFGPLLRAAFPNEHSRTRFDVAHALAEAALATPARTDDAAQAGGDVAASAKVQIIGGPCDHKWAAMTMAGHMSCIYCRQTRPMTALEAAQWTK